FALGELRSELPQLDASLEVTLHRDGSEIPSHHPLVAAMLDAARSTGLEPATVGMSA
ncbi:MAG: hypothetical protein GWM90_11420, partial [Gemmatimonadetes bacterium]|nr:hypothetical protein [Gemmatimonadota bacterium]NIQ54598.1 hypothetical protein [Gemmatimonadota bacterium]NIU74803.1 hypothetical protein [Gammaproteobacteria bacterium]NIX44703.1 hypothetical protein [Gemmatimonadota bacterium]